MSRIVYLLDRDFVLDQIGITELETNIYQTVHDHMIKEAAANDVTYVEQGQIFYKAWIEGRDLTEPSRANIVRFFVFENAGTYPEYFMDGFCKEREDCLFTERVQTAVKTYIQYAWFPTALLGALLFLIPLGLNRHQMYGAFYFKGLGLLLCLHPFLVFAHQRYYGQLILLIALACGALKMSDMRQFWANVTHARTISIVEIGQFVCWLVAGASVAIWITGVNPLV